jgi:hypothetical protein
MGNQSIHKQSKHTLPRSIYTHDGKCLHSLPRSYLDVAATAHEVDVCGRAATTEEEEAGVRAR